ncbi:MAG: 2-oxoacid:acceptor oxidoreductase family protein [Candidatus Thermoplasmatota archaeon]
MRNSWKGRIEVRIAGFGGQGVILSTVIAGKAVSLYEKKEAVVMEAYGPESRGGASSGTVVIDDVPVDYPYVSELDILVVMSQEAYRRFRPELKPDGYLLIEKDLVELHKDDGAKIYAIPATRFAEEMGNKIVANIVMLGFLTGVTGLTSYDSMKSAILDTVPPKTRKLNEDAYNKGYEYGKKLKEA